MTATLRSSLSSDGLQALFDARWSCRAFQAAPVPRPTVERILATAQRPASWCNAQPWRIHLLGGDAVEAARTALPDWDASHAAEPDFAWPAAYRGVSLDRRRACGFALYEAVGVARAVERALHPGGVCVIKDLDAGPRWKARWNRVHDRVVAGPEPIHCRPLDEMTALFARVGLDVKRSERIDGAWTPYAHYVIRLHKPG